MSKEFYVRERQFFAKDSLIMKEGEEGNHAYLIQSGSVLVYTTDEDDEVVELARLEAGQIIGEMTLVFEGMRSANVKAIEDCNLIQITRSTFNEKIKKSDPTVRAIVRMLSERVASANHALAQQDAKIEDVGRKTRAIFRSAMSNLPAELHGDFRQAILPKLDDLFEAIRPFGKSGAASVQVVSVTADDDDDDDVDAAAEDDATE